ncbi:MAG: hypothetical protein LBB23_02535 [Rickettsiales bacterium]|nr:hypothetical protein [Rickettsiales bacterium]
MQCEITPTRRQSRHPPPATGAGKLFGFITTTPALRATPSPAKGTIVRLRQVKGTIVRLRQAKGTIVRLKLGFEG